MTDAPERIEAFMYGEHRMWAEQKNAVFASGSNTYLRADLVPSWQPIETAPEVKVAVKGQRFWFHDAKSGDTWIGVCKPKDGFATHWQPLTEPEPPDD